MPRRSCLLGVVLALAALACTAFGSGAAVSPGTIVFSSDRTGDDAVYAVDPETGRLSAVAPANAAQPVPAPDGGAVAYLAWDPTTQTETVTVARSGQPPVRLPGCTAGLATIGSWSPDSTRFACDGGRAGILAVTADGASSTVVSPHGIDPAWSPDGSTVAFSTQGIWIAPAMGGPPTQLSSELPDGGLAWSPDSSRLAFATFNADFTGADLYVVGRDGRPPRLVASKVGDSSGYFFTPTWSPDGRVLTIGSERGLLAIDPSTGTRRLLTHDAGEAPVWSADGQLLAYIVPRTRDRDAWDVAVVRADGGGRRLLTSAFPDGGSNLAPAWSARPLGTPLVRPGNRIVPVSPVRQRALPHVPALLTATAAGAAVTDGECDVRLWTAGRRPVHVDACRRYCRLGGDPTVLARLADGAVATICREPGLNEYETLELAAPPYRNFDDVAFFYADDTGGNDVDAMLAAGRVLVFEVATYDDQGNVADRNKYTFDPAHPGGAACPDDGGSETSGHDHGCRLLHSVTGCMPLDAAAGVIAFQCDGPTLRVVNLNGAVVGNWSLPSDAVSASLDGHALYVLARTALQTYDLRTRTLVGTRTLAPDIIQPTLVGAAHGLVAYVRGSAVHLLRLRDKADVALRLDREAGAVVARLDDAGLFYGYARAHTRPSAQIGFLPTGVVRRLLGP
jgi:Tol biopolymer transport system component